MSPRRRKDRGVPDKAGVLAVRRGNEGTEVCLVRWAGTDDWGIPKGFVDPGHTPEEAALEEAWEEAGLRGRLVGDAVGTYTYVKRGTEYTVAVYVMTVVEEPAEWPEMEYRERHWLTLADARARLASHPVLPHLERALLGNGRLMRDGSLPARPGPREFRVPAGRFELHVREAGSGPPIVVLHGGPDFSHDYLFPEMDRLADAFRLIAYDQRGRGRSGAGVEPGDVTLASEMEDLEALRCHFGLESVTLLGHSWGALLAMEYAIRHPGRVSRLILMNPAPASHADLLRLRSERQRTAGDDLSRMRAIAATPAYASGDPETDAAYYRIHFRSALARPEPLERLVASLRPGMTAEGIVKSRAIEARLYAETWLREDYDLLPGLAALRVPTLVLHGDRDLIPVACAERIAGAIPGARFVVLERCGHFAYLERPAEVRELLAGFLGAGV